MKAFGASLDNASGRTLILGTPVLVALDRLRCKNELFRNCG